MQLICNVGDPIMPLPRRLPKRYDDGMSGDSLPPDSLKTLQTYFCYEAPDQIVVCI